MGSAAKLAAGPAADECTGREPACNPATSRAGTSAACHQAATWRHAGVASELPAAIMPSPTTNRTLRAKPFTVTSWPKPAPACHATGPDPPLNHATRWTDRRGSARGSAGLGNGRQPTDRPSRINCQGLPNRQTLPEFPALPPAKPVASPEASGGSRETPEPLGNPAEIGSLAVEKRRVAGVPRSPPVSAGGLLGAGATHTKQDLPSSIRRSALKPAGSPPARRRPPGRSGAGARARAEPR
jgi:hypothetical protein